jgi:PAS domain S-box-containing protein
MPENEGMAIRGESAQVVPQHIDSHDVAQPGALPDDVPVSSTGHGIADAQLADELADSTRLQALSTQLIREGDLAALYQQILEAAIAVMRSDMGSIQLLHPEKSALQLLASSGFDPASAAFWEWVRVDSGTACGQALRTAERVIVPDVETCDYIVGTEDLDYYHLSGIRAVQTTPLIARDGRLIGMISTHWRTQHQPARRALESLDVLARFACDLIERKQAEEALAHLAAIVTSAEDAIVSKTLDGIVTSWNTSAERMFGYTAQEMVGQSILRLIPLERYGEEDRILAHLRAGESIEHFETLRLTKDGQALEVSLTISPVRDSAGTIIGASKIVRDITARRQTERLLAEQNHILELIASGYPLDECLTELTRAVVRLQPGTRASILLADETRTRFTALFAADIPSAFGVGLKDAPINDLAIGTCGESVFSGQPITCVDIAHDEQWSAMWRELCVAHGILACHSEPVIGSDGQPLASLMLCFDTPRPPSEWELRIARFGTHLATIVIERDRADQALRTNELALLEANERKDDFLGIASHELRTPLTSIIANVQMARRQFAMLDEMAHARDEESGQRDDLTRRLEQSEQLLERTDRQLARLNRLVGDLVDTSRIRTGRLELVLEPCDLLPIVSEAVQEQRAAWPHRSITLSLPRRARVPILADGDRIGQVVTNLLTNALKYSLDEAVVAVSVRLVDGGVRVALRDQGPGISPEEQMHLFEQFYRVPGIEQQSGSGVGLGLGLHICKTIVERHDGTIGVESAVGKGSTFWFTLPLAGVD